MKHFSNGFVIEVRHDHVRAQFPEIGVYRSFESPNYKVTVGNFRSKDEALRIYNALKKTYPTAYIIKDNIEYPL